MSLRLQARLDAAGAHYAATATVNLGLELELLLAHAERDEDPKAAFSELFVEHLTNVIASAHRAGAAAALNNDSVDSGGAT